MINRTIEFANGTVLELEMEKEFLEYVRKHFCLPTINCITSNHIKQYILQATNNAITKVEHQVLAATG